MTKLRRDWISLLEASYNLELPAEAWLQTLVDGAVPLIERPGVPISLFTFSVTPTTHRVIDVAVHGPPFVAEATRSTNAAASQAEIDLIYRCGFFGGTLSELVFPRFPGSREMFLEKTGGQARDVFGWCGHTGRGTGVMLNASLPTEETTAPIAGRRWSRVIAHMAAGLRLRNLLNAMDLDNANVEAIFDAGGRLRDARERARSGTARERLRRAVRAIDRARTVAGRTEADTALQEWEALVAGRWSLVDRFDTDGRRFVVAMRNDPAHPDPRGLSVRERAVAEFIGLGHTSKQIGYRLGVSVSSVDNSIAQAMMKLGMGARTELAAFFSPAGPRAKLAEVALDGDRFLVGEYPRVHAANLDALTGAEQQVAALLVGGSTYPHIARTRASHERTVANQVQSIYRKLKVRSRVELASRLQARP